jgi:xylan 1,4-beta-xylosidase
MAQGVRGAQTDINALASRDQHSIAVMVWNYHDDDVIDAGAPVELQIAGIPAKQARLRHFRVDNDTSNSYSAWKRMGSPARPSAAQIAELQQASELAQLGQPAMLATPDGKATVKMQLPRQAVSLIVIDY